METDLDSHKIILLGLSRQMDYLPLIIFDGPHNGYQLTFHDNLLYKSYENIHIKPTYISIQFVFLVIGPGTLHNKCLCVEGCHKNENTMSESQSLIASKAEKAYADTGAAGIDLAGTLLHLPTVNVYSLL